MARVTVTERAAEELRNVLAEAAIQSDQTLRLSALPGGDFVLRLDQRRQDDEVVQSEGTDILIVASDLVEALGEITVDYHETPEDGRLVISTNP